MRSKLKLDVERLQVESFAVQGQETERGTVRGLAATEEMSVCDGGGTCAGSCVTCDVTCGYSCDWSCGGTCQASCEGTCNFTCYGFSCDVTCRCGGGLTEDATRVGF